jgi:hypothetical protein
LEVGLNRNSQKAEKLFPLWLLIKGVNVEQWEKRVLGSA